MEPLLGEIKMFAGNFAPQGWYTCEGQTLSIAQNTALFSILGTTYGGDGVQTFQLPDLRSAFPTQCTNISGNRRTPYFLGQIGGLQQVTLSAQQLPAHSHNLQAVAGGANQFSPENNFLSISIDKGSGNPSNIYNDGSDTTVPFTNLSVKSVSPTGGSQPVDVTPPYLAMQYIIAWQGIYPSRP
jgi:microcystin-dependent protein